MNGLYFSSSHGAVLSFRYSISEEDYPPWRNLPKFNESPERSLHHLLQRFNDFNSRLLNFSQSGVSRSTLIIGKHKPSHWGFCDTRTRMADISPWVYINVNKRSKEQDQDSPTIMNGCVLRSFKTPDSLEELQPPRRAFILRLKLRKKDGKWIKSYFKATLFQYWLLAAMNFSSRRHWVITPETRKTLDPADKPRPTTYQILHLPNVWLRFGLVRRYWVE